MVTRGLISRWKLDKDYRDSWGVNHLTLTSTAPAPTRIKGKQGMNFNTGSSTTSLYIDSPVMPDGSAIPTGNVERSVTMWINFASVGTQQCLFNFSGKNNVWGKRFGVLFGTNKKIVLWQYYDSTTSNRTFENNEIHHFAFVKYAGANSVLNDLIYCDGTLLSTSSNAGASPNYGVISFENTILNISGYWEAAWQGNKSLSSQRDVRLYNVALSPFEVSQIYHEAAFTSSSNLAYKLKNQNYNGKKMLMEMMGI